MNNTDKQYTYAQYKVKLSKALRHGFWLEAVFIEYAMIEDRTESVLRHEGTIKLTNKQGHPLKLSIKLNKIHDSAPFTDKQIRKSIPLSFIDEIWTWKDRRDAYIHSLMKNPYCEEDAREIAEEGNEIVRQLDNKVKSVNRIFDKKTQAAI